MVGATWEPPRGGAPDETLSPVIPTKVGIQCCRVPVPDSISHMDGGRVRGSEAECMIMVSQSGHMKGVVCGDRSRNRKPKEWQLADLRS